MSLTESRLYCRDQVNIYGVCGIQLSWFTSYFTSRSQQVYCNGSLSELRGILFGVPQGSILGPLLFLIYINDLPNASPLMYFILFADDSNVFYSHACLDTLYKNVNKELKLIAQWFHANKLSLNLEKTNYIFYLSLPGRNVQLNFHEYP